MSPSSPLRLRGNLRLLFVLTLTAVVLIPLAIIKTVRTVSASIARPAPDAQADFVQMIPLTANDVIYSPTTKLLYASVPSSVGAGGNSIKTIDPTTGAITSSVFMGSEPNKLAIASDGTTVYAGLDGAYSVRKFDASTQTAGTQFSLGSDPSSSGLLRVADLAITPGNPNAVATGRRNTNFSGVSVAVFDSGVQRPTVTSSFSGPGDFLAFSASATKLYSTGSSSGLATMTINANGVSITGTSALAQGQRIKFDNGVVYANNGQVIDPDTNNGTLKGTFSVSGGNVSPTAFVTDSSVGRAYYLLSDFTNSTVKTIRVFDLNTFVLIGTITVTGVNGDTTNLVRWGSNGLAFRTSGGQLVMVQSSLIPSADPIPTPTAAITPTPSPTPTPPATFVRQVPLATNDMIYSAGKQSLYASVPSSAGISGNTIMPIDPVTATVGSPVFIGSEPNKLAVSDDQHIMYVGLNGAGAIRRFDLTTQTAGLQFALGFDSFNGLRTAVGLAVMPGTPGTVAVNRSNSTIAIYDDSVQRPQTQNSGNLAFRSASTLYAANGSIAKLNVTAQGLSLVSTTLTNSSGTIIYDNGLVYMSGGAVVDPETGLVKGVFNSGSNSAMALDSAAGRIYFLSDSSFNTTLRAFDINTFLPLGSVTISGLSGSPTSLIRWGSNGLAFRTGTQIFLVQTALVNSGDAVPAATPTPSPIPSPSPPYIPTFTRKLDLAANDLVFNQSTQRIYASVAGYQITNGNSITTIDPQTAAIGPSVFVGSEPNKLALGDDGNTLYTNLDGAAAIRRFDVSNQTAGLQFSPTVSGTPVDMKVMPGSPQTLAVSLGSGASNNVLSIYDNGVRRTGNVSGNFSGISGFEFNGPTTIYGSDTSSSGSLVKFAVNPNGVSPTTITSGVFTNFGPSLKFANGLLYANSGRIVEPETPKAMGTLQGSGIGGSFVVDTALGKAFFVSNPGAGVVLTAYDLTTFVPLGSFIVLPNVGGSPGGLVRWGANGLAFRVASSSSSASATNPTAIYLVQSALVSNNGSIPTSVQFASATTSVNEGTLTLTITVNRTGDVSTTTNVDFTTSDGTATAGSDYTATTGTLSFAPGQLSKTFTVPIINDNVFEGNETFNLTLSNATSGVIVGPPSSMVITIQDNESTPNVQITGNLRVTEGNAGTKIFNIPVTLSVASTQTVSVSYATADSSPISAIAGTDYVSNSGTLTFPPGTTSAQINVTVNGDTTVEPDETFLLKLSNPVNVNLFTSQVTVTIGNDDSSFQFSAAEYSVTESAKSVNVTVTRAGDTSAAASVNYATSDAAAGQSCSIANGKASSQCDYIATLGVLTFTAGQSSKTITILVIDDGYQEATETFSMLLSSPTVGALGTVATATISVFDDIGNVGINPVDNSAFFIRENYLDFLNREPDQLGFDFWTNQISACGNDASCVALVRVNVSAAFFLSIEFQQTGYLVERMYKEAYGDAKGTSVNGGSHSLPVPIVRLNEFLRDTQRIGRGVVVNQTGWETVLENNKQAYALEFVQTSRFTNEFPSAMTPADFVDKLNGNAGNVLSPPERQTVLNLFAGAADSSDASARARALRRIADDENLYNAEFHRAFVLSQYFGYLRRNPNDAPDSDYTGYDFWLGKLLQFDGDYIKAEMVKAFISSDEYRKRFGP